MRICAQKPRLKLIANIHALGAGDGVQPQPYRRPATSLRTWSSREARSVSHRAIAAVLALDGLSGGERLAAFSLASFANRAEQAWPGTRIAATRAGLSRSQYLRARDALGRRGLISVEAEGGGRGKSALVTLMFAIDGEQCGEVNAELFELVLGYSRARGSARILLAALAAAADGAGVVEHVTTDQLCASSGLTDRTYRRARAELLESGAVLLEDAGGGRARTNRWRVRGPRLIDQVPLVAPRSEPPRGAPRRPLVAQVPAGPAVRVPKGQDAGSVVGLTEVDGAANPGQDATVLRGNPGQDATVPRGNPRQDRTLLGETPVRTGPFSPETPAQTPAETPAPNARTGREPKNLRTTPPDPPQGGSARAEFEVQEEYVSLTGRRRRRTVRVDLDEVRRQLDLPTSADRGDWERIRTLFSKAVSESVYTIWLEPLQLVATDQARILVVAADPDIDGWIRGRFEPLLDRCAIQVGRSLRIAAESELRALGVFEDVQINHQEVS
jgi:hypothetical protein